MKLQTKITEIFQTQFPELVERIEKEVYSYLEEMIISKGFKLDTSIDYKDPSFRDSLHSILDTIANSLNSVGVPRDQIEVHLKKDYRYFQTTLELKTYKDWLHKEFRSKIDFLLFSEILNYFVDPSKNIIIKMIDFALLDESFKSKLNDINEKYPNLSKFLRWQKKLEDKLIGSIFESTDFKDLYQFKNPQKDLNTLYNIYSIARFLDYQNRFNLSPAVPFLIGEVEKWCKEYEKTTIIKPNTLYSGLSITKTADIDVDVSICQQHLKELLVDTVNNIPSPIFADPFRVYYIVESMKLLNLKLTAKFLESITKKTEENMRKENLAKLKTDEIAMIPVLFKDLGFGNKITADDFQTFFNILKDRTYEGLYCRDSESKTCTVESLWGAVTIFMESKGLELGGFEKVNIAKIIDILLNEIESQINTLSIKNADNFGRILVAIKTLDRIDTYFDANIIMELEKFLFSKETTGSNLSSASESSITKLLHEAENISKKSLPDDDVFESISPVSPKLPEDIGVKGIDPETAKSLMSLKQIQEGTTLGVTSESQPIEKPSLGPKDDFFDFDEGTSKSATGSKTAPVSVGIDEPLPNGSADIVKYYMDLPNLASDVIENTNPNYTALAKPFDFTTNNLEFLFKHIALEKMLRLKHALDAEKIHSLCRRFWKKNAFGEADANDPDVISTYYGLSIYNEYNIMNKIDIFQVHDFLLKEIKFFNPYKMNDNVYLFQSLRILDKYKIQLMKYESIIQRIQDIDYTKYEDYNPLLETYYQILPLKILAPELNLNAAKSRFLAQVKAELRDDGSIGGVVSDTAIVLITMGLLDLFLQEFELCQNMFNYLRNNADYLNASLETNHINWHADDFGYGLELNMSYWSALALTFYKPTNSNILNIHVCPGCGQYFKAKPKFCNVCGHKF